MTPQTVLDFWFSAETKEKWWAKDADFDALVREKFAAAHMAAACGELDNWAASAHGALALIILLDQVPRNIYRDTAHAFATDRLALNIAEDGIAKGLDNQLAGDELIFFYIPFMHAESKRKQEQSVALYKKAGLELNLKFALQHKEIIDRFGRYPHRNAFLGRRNTPAETTYLQKNGTPF